METNRGINPYKTAVAENFGRAAATYHQQAPLQRHCAQQLIHHLTQGQGLTLPPGEILEVGCGTGFLSRQLVQQFPHHSCYLTDLAPAMVNFCREQLLAEGKDRPAPLRFGVVDGEQLPPPCQPYALIASSFALQWFENPIATIQDWLSQVTPGGCLALAFPSGHSFPEWRSACDRSHLPYTANPLPDFQTLVGTFAPLVRHCQVASEWLPCQYPQAKAFFQHLKALGTGHNRSGHHLSPQQLRHLWRTWDQSAAVGGQYRSSFESTSQITVSYHGVYLILQR
ncbi:methyltransferase [Prochlorothrix hollandica]|uniref:methyltransferase n=1 Tax=Prochlorothrix hollandica TaxID=1223 RepID=UPI000347FBE3|nr:methyltransferase [Prochlorothrix hollandica]